MLAENWGITVLAYGTMIFLENTNTIQNIKHHLGIFIHAGRAEFSPSRLDWYKSSCSGWEVSETIDCAVMESTLGPRNSEMVVLSYPSFPYMFLERSAYQLEFSDLKVSAVTSWQNNVSQTFGNRRFVGELSVQMVDFWIFLKSKCFLLLVCID